MTETELRQKARETLEELVGWGTDWLPVSAKDTDIDRLLAALLKAKEAGAREERARCLRLATGGAFAEAPTHAEFEAAEAIASAIRQDTGRG
jgi:aromatic ring hydroxylase